MLIRKAKYIQQREGWDALVKRAFLFLARSIFDHQTYYIGENTQDGRISFKPRIDNCSFHVISSPEGLDKVLAEGADFSSYLNDNFNLTIDAIKERISRGAILFCCTVDKEIANAIWMALNGEVKEDLDIVPYTINYESEACLGSAETIARYRRLGIHTYCVSNICRFAYEKGLKLTFTLPKKILAARKVHAKVGSLTLGEIDCWRVLWWKFWREKPLKETQ